MLKRKTEKIEKRKQQTLKNYETLPSCMATYGCGSLTNVWVDVGSFKIVF